MDFTAKEILAAFGIAAFGIAEVVVIALLLGLIFR
jgi:hypothetical protein